MINGDTCSILYYAILCHIINDQLWLYSMVYSMVIPSQWYNQWRRAGLLKGLLFAPGHRRRTNPCASVVPGRWVFEMGKIYFSAAWNIGKTMGNPWKNGDLYGEWVIINYCLVVTGTMEFWMTFHNRWECHHPNWRTLHHFSHGLKPTTNQRFSWDVHGFWWTWGWTL